VEKTTSPGSVQQAECLPVPEGGWVLLPAAVWRSMGKRLENWKCISETMTSPPGDAVNRGKPGAAQLHLT